MKRICLGLTLVILLGLPLHSSDLVHVIRKGDTLYSLSQTYHVSVDDIIRLNGIDNPSMLSIGMEIRIPAVYIIEKGDTFYSLAKKFNVTVDELFRMNNVDGSALLKIGDRILVPVMEREEELAGSAETRVPEAVEAETVPSQEEQGTKPFFWPHTGQSTRLTGKLEGLQFEGKDGDTITSVCNGKVVWVGPYRGYNKIVFVQTIDDYIFGYGGNNDILVKVGDNVHPGTEIGLLGINPHEGKARMFFFVYRNGVAVDPYTAPRD